MASVRRGDPAVGQARLELRETLRIPPETNDEAAVLTDPELVVTELHAGTRQRLAEHQATLNQPAFELHVRGGHRGAVPGDRECAE